MLAALVAAGRGRGLALMAALSLIGSWAAASAQADTLSCTSRDGRWRLVAQGHTLSLLDAAGVAQHSWPVADQAGRPGQVLALAEHAARRSFVIALRGLNEVWELSVDPQAPPVFEGLVHDYRLGEGLARPGFLAIRRSLLSAPVLGIVVDGRHPWVQVHQAGGTALLHLDVRRLIPRVPAAAGPGTVPAANGC